MDPLIERFERILRSYFQNGVLKNGNRSGSGSGGFSRGSAGFGNGTTGFDDDWDGLADEQDFRDAFAELDDFLKTGTSSGADPGAEAYGAGKDPPPPEMLREDYRELGVSFGAPFSDVKRAYRKLMRTHHPDRHGSDAEKQAQATRKAQRLNIAFHRIRAWEEAKHTT